MTKANNSSIDLSTIRRMVHLDFHLNDWVENVCVGLNPRVTAKELKHSGVQCVTIFAKDAYGHCYYPSQYCAMHPNLKTDYVGKMTEALKKEGIYVLLYFSAVYDAKGSKEFNDCLWMRTPTEPGWGGWINERGSELCFNSPYSKKRVFPQLEELAKGYPIDGFWLDNVSMQAYEPCYCQYCEAEFEKLSGHEIPRDKNSKGWMTYWNWKREKLALYHKTIHKKLDAIQPGLILASNTLYTYANPENSVTYVDMISTDPNADARHLIFASRYDENQGIPHNLIVKRFGQSWGHWSYREPHELKLESAGILAHNGAVYYADQLLPSGNLQPGAIPLMKEVFDFVEERESFCIQTEPVADVAVLHETNSFFKKHESLGVRDAREDAEGATIALTFLGELVTAINEIKLRERLQDFRMIILADQTILTPATEKLLRYFVSNGGTLLVTGETSLYDSKGKPRDDFGLDDVLGVSYIRPCPFQNVFWQVDVEANDPYKKIPRETNISESEMLNKAINLAEESGMSIRQALLSGGQVTEDDILRITAEKLGLIIVDLDKLQIDPNILVLVPRKVAEHYHIIPIAADKNKITIAIADPFNLQLTSDLKILLDTQIKMVIAKQEQIERAIEKYYSKSQDELSTYQQVDQSSGWYRDMPGYLRYTFPEKSIYRYEELLDFKRYSTHLEEETEPFKMPKEFINPKIPYQITSPTHYVRLTTAREIARIIHPIQESKDKFYTVCGFAPPGEISEHPAITLNDYGKGKAIYIASSIFRTYAQTSESALLHWIKYARDLVPNDKKPLIDVDSEMPVEVSVTNREKEIFIHILNMSIDRRDPSMHGTSRIPPARNICLDIFCPVKPKTITLEPGHTSIPYQWKNNRVKVWVKQIEIHGIVHIELKG